MTTNLHIDNPTLAVNLRALARHDGPMVERLAETEPAALEVSASKAGPLTACLTTSPGDHADDSTDAEDTSAQPIQPPRTVALASRYDPQREASKLLDQIDYDKAACVVVLGLGLGYHVAQLAREIGQAGLVIVYEPDPAVVRATLEHVDHSAWLGQANVIVCDHTTDRAALTSRVSTLASVVTQGTQLLTHPPTRQLHGQALSDFAEMVTETLSFCRTNVATALVNSARTCRNLACNLDVYAAGATTDALLGAAKGYPAVCVAAGPSLVKNVHLLLNPEFRRNVVVIAVQTTLRPLLDRGIRPDYVTALDYSAISTRFYESLPPLDDITLVAEPKVHPAVVDAFPGPVRMMQNTFNDNLLGRGEPGQANPNQGQPRCHANGPTSSLYRPITPMNSGATVAHLSFYLAQHLGCDPIMFIGQDLGFSDGLYYVPGTAAWEVWAPELNPFNTVEMMEWQRIARSRNNIKRKEDIHGKPIFADEQMLTYLKQFERDFAAASRQGQTVIDATEGGMAKEHTTRMTLAAALKDYARDRSSAGLNLPTTERSMDPDRLHLLTSLLRRRIRETHDLRQTSRRTVRILQQMKDQQGNRAKMQSLFRKVKKNQHHVHHDLAETFSLVNMLNTMGTYKRQRADREIGRIKADAQERQSRQIDRDLQNIDWLIQACDEALSILDEASQRARASHEAQTEATRNLTPDQREKGSGISVQGSLTKESALHAPA